MKPMGIDQMAMPLNCLVKRLAVTCGMVRRDITSMIPTRRRQLTMVRAMNDIIRYSIHATGKP